MKNWNSTVAYVPLDDTEDLTDVNIPQSKVPDDNVDDLKLTDVEDDP